MQQRATAFAILLAVALVAGTATGQGLQSFEEIYQRRLEQAFEPYERRGAQLSREQAARLTRQIAAEAWVATSPSQREAWRREFRATVGADPDLVATYGSFDGVRSPMDYQDQIAERPGRSTEPAAPSEATPRSQAREPASPQTPSRRRQRVRRGLPGGGSSLGGMRR